MKKNTGKEKAPSTSTTNMERNRRTKTSELYAGLQTMVPNLFPKATRMRIIEETIDYIKSLEEVLSELESQRMAMGLQTQGNSNVTATVSNRTAFFGLRIPSRPGLCTMVTGVFERHGAEVLNITVVSRGGCTDFTVTALVAEEGAVERIKSELMAI